MRVITFNGAVKVDIEWHLTRHAESIDFVTRKYAAKYHISREYNPDDYDEIRQAIVELLIKRHESPSYDHDKFTLWTYVQPALNGVVHETLDQYRHFDKDEKRRPITVVIPPSDFDEEGIDSLDALEEMGRVAPVNWHGRGYGEQASSLTTEEHELAEKLTANLTDEELEVLDASVGRSIHQAAEYLEMSYATYYRRLRDAKARAKALVASNPLSKVIVAPR